MFLWKVSFKILNSGIILKTFTYVSMESQPQNTEFRNNPETFTYVSMEGQPQNTELRNNPENFHPCNYAISNQNSCPGSQACYLDFSTINIWAMTREKAVFVVSDHVRHKPDCSATYNSKNTS